MVATKPIPRDLAKRLAWLIRLTASVDESTGCILRTSLVNSTTGYASVSYLDTNGGPRQSLYAHRVMWTHLRGPIPNGMTIDHLCKTRNCVNVKHMEVVAQGVNALRSENPMAINARKTKCQKGHDFVVRPDGRRRCNECRKKVAA